MATEPTVVEILRAAKAEIADPANWCQGRAKIDGRCCATRAFAQTAPGEGIARDLAWEFLLRAAMNAGFSIPSRLNDQTDHATVMAMYDDAIALAEGSANA